MKKLLIVVLLTSGLFGNIAAKESEKQASDYKTTKNQIVNCILK